MTSLILFQLTAALMGVAVLLLWFKRRWLSAALLTVGLGMATAYTVLRMRIPSLNLEQQELLRLFELYGLLVAAGVAVVGAAVLAMAIAMPKRGTTPRLATGGSPQPGTATDSISSR